MRGKIILLLVSAMLFGILVGCQTQDSVDLTAEKELEIKQAYLALMKNGDEKIVDDLTLYVVWHSNDIYALYMDCTGQGYLTEATVVELPKESTDGTFAGSYRFEFPETQLLIIYKDGAFYSLKTAWAEGILKAEHVEALLKDNLYLGLGRYDYSDS